MLNDKLTNSYSLLIDKVVGLSGLEPETFPLSEERSNQLSYRPEVDEQFLLVIVHLAC